MYTLLDAVIPEATAGFEIGLSFLILLGLGTAFFIIAIAVVVFTIIFTIKKNKKK